METDSQEPRRHMLKRSGKGNPPLVFQGILIAEVTGPNYSDAKRWHDLRLYRTVNQRYVVEIVLVKAIAGQKSHHSAVMVEDLTEAREAFYSHDPMQGIDFPNKPSFEQRSKKLAEALGPVYRERVDMLFKSIISS
jgi:hypothetical protein